MNATPGPPVAPGTIEIAGGPKMSRSEARRLREEAGGLGWGDLGGVGKSGGFGGIWSGVFFHFLFGLQEMNEY